MRWYHPLLVVAVAALAAPPAPAISLFSKRVKVNPAERVPELITLVRTAPDEHKRVAAAEELRQFDAAAFPQIVPVLADVLKTDASTAVRAEAAHSLGRLRPASGAVAQALDNAASQDASKRVRWQARAALLFYPASVPHTPTKATEPPVPPLSRPAVTNGPPPAPTPMVPANPVLLPVPGQGPPLPAAPAPSGIARPLPRGPAPGPAPAPPPMTTAEPPLAAPEPVAVPQPADGPVLAPPP
jgi:hypothetical protein